MMCGYLCRRSTWADRTATTLLVIVRAMEECWAARMLIRVHRPEHRRRSARADRSGVSKRLLSADRLSAALQRLHVGEGDVAQEVEGRRFTRTDDHAAGNGGRAGQPWARIRQMLI